MRLLVTGGRNYSNPTNVRDLLTLLRPEVLIHGDANGLDRMAGLTAHRMGCEVRAFPADWAKHGRAAGPVRNRQMLNEGAADMLLAFPGGVGTANMVKQAVKFGLPVLYSHV